MGFEEHRDKAVQFFRKFFRIGELEDPNHQKREILLLSNSRGGNISGVVMALDTGANPDAKDPETGKTALHYAVEKNLYPSSKFFGTVVLGEIFATDRPDPLLL